MMRNIPMYHTTKELQQGQVLGFDIKKPDPGRRLRNRQEHKEHDAQEFIIATKGGIFQREKQETEKIGQNGKKETMTRQDR